MTVKVRVTYNPGMSREGDAQAPAGYDPRAFPPVAVSVDVVVLTIRGAHMTDGRLRGGQLSALLVERSAPPFKGYWALPGGFVRPDETLVEAAVREVEEETGLPAFTGHLEQLGSYGDPGRDERMRVVSVAYLALMPNLPSPSAGTDASDAQWRPVSDLLGRDERALAFDHDVILADAVERARSKLEYTNLATSFVGTNFTLGDLRRIYEAVWDVEGLEPANFRRKVLATGMVKKSTRPPLNRGSGRPAQLYLRGSAELLDPPMFRPEPGTRSSRKMDFAP